MLHLQVKRQPTQMLESSSETTSCYWLKASYLSLGSRLRSLVTGEPLDARQLDSRQIGNKEITQYGNRFYIETQNKVVRKEKVVDMKAIPTTSYEVKENMEKLRVRRASTDAKLVNESGTKEELYAEFSIMEPHLLSRRQKDKVPRLTATQLKNTSKKSITKLLVGVRTSLFRRTPESKAILEATVKEEAGSSKTTRATREVQLSHEYYAQKECPARLEPIFQWLVEFE